MFVYPILAGLAAAPKVVDFYLAAMSAFALCKEKPDADREAGSRLAVLVAARNEAAVIGQLLDSLREQDYPDVLYDIYVAPNQCTDQTAAVARAKGARILTCSSAVRNKGDALAEALDQLLDLPEAYDAFVVFDADHVADRRFLAEMDRALQAGARVAKGRIESKNPYDSWVAGCYSIYFGIQSMLYNRARAACGLSAKLAGTGFAVSADVLRERGGWRTQTITEDVEFAAQLACAGEQVRWVPRAISYDEAPVTLAVSMKQRKRWCSGVMQVSRRYVRALWRGCAARGQRPLARARRFDAAMLQMLPYTRVWSAGMALPLLLSAHAAGLTSWAAIGAGLLTGALVSAVGSCALAAMIAFGYARHDARILKSVLGFPLFMWSWLPLQLLAWFHDTRVWEEIQHTRAVALDEVPALANPRLTSEKTRPWQA